MGSLLWFVIKTCNTLYFEAQFWIQIQKRIIGIEGAHELHHHQSWISPNCDCVHLIQCKETCGNSRRSILDPGSRMQDPEGSLAIYTMFQCFDWRKTLKDHWAPDSAPKIYIFPIKYSSIHRTPSTLSLLFWTVSGKCRSYFTSTLSLRNYLSLKAQITIIILMR